MSEKDIDSPFTNSENTLPGETDKQRRKRIFEIMENDREAYKARREENWMRPVGEKDSEEFLRYYKKIDKPTIDLLCKNQIRFLELNDRKSAIEQFKNKFTPIKRPAVVSHNIYIFDIEDSFVYLDAFLVEGAPDKLRSVAKMIDDMIIDVACKMFFYKDLKNFYQPNCLYFSAFDDGIDLRYYNFGDDRLKRKEVPRKDDPEMGKERAYRLRAMMSLYSDPNHLVNRYSSSFMNDLVRLRSELDESCKKLNSLAYSIFALLSARPNSELYLVAPRSLPRLLALCSAMGIDRFFRAENVYSSLVFGRGWCFEDIVARNPKGSTIYVCGGHSEVGDDAKRIKAKYFMVRGKTDMMQFAQTLDLLE